CGEDFFGIRRKNPSNPACRAACGCLCVVISNSSTDDIPTEIMRKRFAGLWFMVVVLSCLTPGEFVERIFSAFAEKIPPTLPAEQPAAVDDNAF
ncbi:MAG: hypothetical protein JW750_04255, partial [Anaerolineaceae bacterium]|nr:hypothetical protein [Anaerolineaceae bacterium]